MSKVLLSLLILVHAAIHLLGLQKALNPSSVPGLSLEVSKPWGVVWLLAAVLFAAAGVSHLLDFRYWWGLALLATVTSQIAVARHFADAKFGTIANVLIFVLALVAAAAFNFQRQTEALVKELRTEARTRSGASDSDSAAPRLDLPPPVQLYLDTAIPPGAPFIEFAQIRQRGEFNLSLAKPAWKRFEATHVATTEPPGFVWSAEVHVAPGVSVFVHDVLVAGRGTVAPYAFGLIPLPAAEDRGGDVARGELLRFLAETPWYPSLLRHRSITWEAVDEHHARAQLESGGLEVSLVFAFGGDHLVQSVRAADRPRSVDDKFVPTPWVGHFSNYLARDGVLIPHHAEVSWVIDGQMCPYFKGDITEVHFE